MSYFAVCTFDLANCDDEDYENAYNDLAKIGFKRDITSDKGVKFRLPTTTTAGEFEGASIGQVRDDLLDKIKKAFSARRFQSEIFVSVGGNWGWGHTTTK